MMKLGVRGKLFFAALAVICLSLGAMYLRLASALEAELTKRLGEELEARASLVEAEASSRSHPLDDLRAWDTLADDLGARARVRVTIIRKDGVVLGDSDLYWPDVAKLENHGSRPEVVGALERGVGTSTRFSTTEKTRMMYMAMPFRRGGEVAGVARVAMPLTQVDDAKRSLSRIVLGGSAGGALVAVALSWAGSFWLSRRVRPIAEAARRMQAGDLGARTRLTGTDELGELGVALDRLASGLSVAVGDLSRERDVLSTVLEEMSEGVLLLDAQGTVALMNPAFREMLLLTAGAIGRPLLEVVRNAELKELIDSVNASRSAEHAEIELGGLLPRRVLVRATPLRAPQRGLLAVLIDVTESRRLESLRRDFVANVSHELRTPVAAVLSAAETLQSGAIADREAAPRFVDIVVRNAERLQRLIEDLLELSRIESRELNLKPEELEFEPVVRGVFAMLQSKATKKKIELLVRVDAKARTVVGDRRAIEQILTNLVDNAVKYCGEGAKVLVSARLDVNSVHVSVEDTGPGIAHDHLPRIFERFYRVDAGRSREVGGTGLGLSIVKHLVEAMGGSVEVRSEVGKGTTFAFSMPQRHAVRDES
jgi:two-component system phosphate regulon sensor histidine kinase PhoR